MIIVGESWPFDSFAGTDQTCDEFEFILLRGIVSINLWCRGKSSKLTALSSIFFALLLTQIAYTPRPIYINSSAFLWLSSFLFYKLFYSLQLRRTAHSKFLVAMSRKFKISITYFRQVKVLYLFYRFKIIDKILFVATTRIVSGHKWSTLKGWSIIIYSSFFIILFWH